MQETGFCIKLDALSPSKAGSRDSSSWAKVLRLQPAVFKTLFKGPLVAALLVDTARVECGVKMDVSTPES